MARLAPRWLSILAAWASVSGGACWPSGATSPSDLHAARSVVPATVRLGELRREPGVFEQRVSVSQQGERELHISLPQAFEPGAIVVFLHGARTSRDTQGDAGARSPSLLTCLVEPALRSLRPVILAPQSETAEWWQPREAAFVLGLVRAARSRWPRARHVVISGYSNGGIASWYFARLYPEFFTGAIPIASNDTVAGDTPLPLYAIHGERDELFASTRVRAAVAPIAKHSRNFAFYEKPGGSHFAPCSYRTELANAARWLEQHAPPAPSDAIARFPSAGEIERLADEPANFSAPAAASSVEPWRLAPEALPTSDDYPEEDHWDTLLLDSLEQRRSASRPAAALRCAAREMARFYAENGAIPNESLRSFVLQSCGSTAVSVAAQFERLDASNDDAVSSIDARARALLAARISQAPGEIGLGFAHANQRAALVGVAADPSVRLRNFKPIVRGTTVKLRGEVLNGADIVSGFVAQGEDGFELCERHGDVAAPAFELDCPLGASDDSTRIDIAVRSRSEVSLHLAASLRVRRSADAGLTYSPRSFGAASASLAADPARAILARINQIRANRGYAPLSLEVAESALHSRLLPHYFESIAAGDAQLRHRVRLSLLAGSRVASTIRSARLHASSSEGSVTPERLVDEALESPLARWTLLDADMKRIAIATAATSGATLATLTTYALFESPNRAVDEAFVHGQITKLAAARGRPPIERDETEPALLTAAKRVSENALSSNAALDQALHEIARERGERMNGCALEALELSHLDFPKQLFDQANRVEIAVTYRRPSGSAWGQFVIFLAWPEATKTR